MRYVRFTDKQTGKPLWLRDDQVLGWFPEKAHYRITPAFDEVDVEVRETGEQILAVMEGRPRGTERKDSGADDQGRDEVPGQPAGGGGELEDEYRRSAGNLVDPKVLAWKETKRFILDLQVQAAAGLENALR